jgi:hypothetical protein
LVNPRRAARHLLQRPGPHHARRQRGHLRLSAIASIEGVAHVERLFGAAADRAAAPDLLVEVPHGADLRAHYDALRSRLLGSLPEDLHVFFHVNTDVGAWAYGRCVAERVVAADPRRSALLVRCLVPRTFVDTNRLEDVGDDLAASGMTAGVAPYVKDARDVTLLLDLHRAYVALVERAYELVCSAGGFALSPHTYGPRTMGIDKVDEQIIHALRRAHEPAAWASWPLRPEIDLLTATGDGTRYAPEGVVRALWAAFRALGHEVAENRTYALHPATQGMRWAVRWPDRFLALEVRRDLLVAAPYAPFEEMRPLPERADHFAAHLADAIDAWLRARTRAP